MRCCRWFVVFLLTALAWAGDYQVVLKSSGKIIHGDLVSEDASSITLRVGVGEVSFKKERLDLERMRELNRGASASSGGATTPQTPSQGADAIRNVESRIAEREKALARLQAQPPSAERDRQIQKVEGELRQMRNAREELKLQHGVAQDSELERLYEARAEAFAEAEEAKQAYDSLPPNAPQSEADAKWQALRDAEKKWQDANDALTKAMEARQAEGTTPK